MQGKLCRTLGLGLGYPRALTYYKGLWCGLFAVYVFLTDLMSGLDVLQHRERAPAVVDRYQADITNGLNNNRPNTIFSR